jgi:hypothetical protein
VRDDPIASQFLPGTALVSGTAGHELKNIIVAMQGFVELTSEGAALSEPVRRCFDEMRIGIARIGVLAGELESLANVHATPKPIAIGTCVRNAQWRCDPGTTVVVDPHHAQAAIGALTRLGEQAQGLDSAAVLLVNQDETEPMCCAVCGESLLRSRGYLHLLVREARLSRDNALREWSRSGHRDRTVRRLTLSVLLYSGHMAGGHIVTNERSQMVGLAFATA